MPDASAGMTCYTCQAGPSEPHKKGCPVLGRIAQLELALRASADPANFANLSQDFELLPDGPLYGLGGELGLEGSKICGGVTVKALAFDIPGLGFRPVLGFNFRTVEGHPVQPILFTTEALGEFMTIKTLIYKAANAAYDAARNMEAERGK